jgi:dTDP-4-dehydrorhamnose 3,5-epimerase
MKILRTDLEDVLILEPIVFSDDRGFFLETYHQIKYRELGITVDFVQDNLSFSHKGTLRGLHYQHPHGQAKLVQVLLGHVYDVAVDVRKGSENFGKWVGAHLSDVNKRQVYIPEGFAHGFCVLSETALFLYKCSDLYAPDCEGGLLFSDPDIGIEWPVKEPILSEKDAAYLRLRDIPVDRVPKYKKGEWQKVKGGWE